MRLGGITEVADELGVSRQRATQLRDRTGFPEPVGEISAGLIWDLDAVARWSGSGIRRSAGRPSKRTTTVGGRYVLETDPIGSGGFADVFRATDLKREQSHRHSVVAVKVLRELTDTEIRRRFMRELRLVSELGHPNIVPILEHGETEQQNLWYAMPLAKGSLAEDIERFAGNEDRIIRVMRQICSGLEYVHGEGIFHRDLKPANVLRIGADTWAISDFGLAREAERTTTALTSTLQGVGTYFYAAPEAWSNAKYAGAEADVFSLGKLLQHLVTGELPVGSEPPDGRFRTVIQKATRHNPDQRYRSVAEMASAIESAASAPDNWQTLDEDAEDLAARLRQEVPDDLALTELADLVLAGPEQKNQIRALRRTIPVMSREALRRLWETDADTFRGILSAYSEHVVDSSWAFDFCDVIADFFERAVLVSGDDDVLHIALRTLLQLGPSHNRWHVRDVVIGLLQRIRSAKSALAAAEAIREVPPSDVDWNLGKFVIRSLHPAIRDEAKRAVAKLVSE